MLTLILLILWDAQGFAQYSVSGKIIDSITGDPLPAATVFLSNATKGTTTSSNGTFLLSNIRSGQYDIVISMIGYEEFSTSMLINSNKENINIKLLRKVMSLRPVIVLPDRVRQRYFEMFKRVFIGRFENAALCKIINPEIIYFDFDKTTNVLSASTDDFLVIENKALGYKIKFLLHKFTYSVSFSGPSFSYYEGQALFEELPGGRAKRKRWLRNRLNTYSGSSMHFFRAAAENKLLNDGFVMHTLVRMANKDRPPDDSIRAVINRLRNNGPALGPATMDSINFWQRKYDMPKIIQLLSGDTLATASVVKRTDQPGIFALTFKDLLYLTYSKKKKRTVSVSSPSVGTNGLPYSILTLQEPNAFFGSNGVLLDPQSLIFEGNWAEYGAMADMLPTDYEPD